MTCTADSCDADCCAPRPAPLPPALRSASWRWLPQPGAAMCMRAHPVDVHMHIAACPGAPAAPPLQAPPLPGPLQLQLPPSRTSLVHAKCVNSSTASSSGWPLKCSWGGGAGGEGRQGGRDESSGVWEAAAADGHVCLEFLRFGQMLIVWYTMRPAINPQPSSVLTCAWFRCVQRPRAGRLVRAYPRYNRHRPSSTSLQGPIHRTFYGCSHAPPP